MMSDDDESGNGTIDGSIDGASLFNSPDFTFADILCDVDESAKKDAIPGVAAELAKLNDIGHSDDGLRSRSLSKQSQIPSDAVPTPTVPECSFSAASNDQLLNLLKTRFEQRAASIRQLDVAQHTIVEQDVKIKQLETEYHRAKIEQRDASHASAMKAQQVFDMERRKKNELREENRLLEQERQADKTMLNKVREDLTAGQAIIADLEAALKKSNEVAEQLTEELMVYYVREAQQPTPSITTAATVQDKHDSPSNESSSVPSKTNKRKSEDEYCTPSKKMKCTGASAVEAVKLVAASVVRSPSQLRNILADASTVAAVCSTSPSIISCSPQSDTGVEISPCSGDVTFSPVPSPISPNPSVSPVLETVQTSPFKRPRQTQQLLRAVLDNSRRTRPIGQSEIRTQYEKLMADNTAPASVAAASHVSLPGLCAFPSLQVGNDAATAASNTIIDGSSPDEDFDPDEFVTSTPAAAYSGGSSIDPDSTLIGDSVHVARATPTLECTPSISSDTPPRSDGPNDESIVDRIPAPLALAAISAATSYSPRTTEGAENMLILQTSTAISKSQEQHAPVTRLPGLSLTVEPALAVEVVITSAEDQIVIPISEVAEPAAPSASPTQCIKHPGLTFIPEDTVPDHSVIDSSTRRITRAMSVETIRTATTSSGALKTTRIAPLASGIMTRRRSRSLSTAQVGQNTATPAPLRARDASCIKKPSPSRTAASSRSKREARPRKSNWLTHSLPTGSKR